MRINPKGLALHLALFGLCTALWGLGTAVVVVCIVFMVVHTI